MTALNKQALIAKIKKQIESFDTVVLKEGEANALVEALEAEERQSGYLREQHDEWERKAISNFEECLEMSARIEELESQRKLAFTACNRWADKFREAEKRIAELEARTPYGYLRQCDGQIQISIGSEQPHNRSGGYATPWFAIYTAAGIGVKGE